MQYEVQLRMHGKLDPRWEQGIFLGRRDETDEVILGTARGIEHARSFRRMSEEERWSKVEYETFIGVPWNPRGLAVETDPASSRRKYITKALVQKHGAMDGCHACSGTSNIHNQRCRARFEAIFVAEAAATVSIGWPGSD